MNNVFNYQGFTIKFSTDENATIHIYVVENESFLIAGSDGYNKVSSYPQFGMSFFTGIPIESIRDMIERTLSFYDEEMAVMAGQFFLDFLSDKNNLKATRDLPEARKESLN